MREIPPMIEALRGSLVVSVQAQPHEPLHGPTHMAVMARAVVEGGASAVRCESPVDIAAIRTAVDVPLIGLWKVGDAGVYITPTVEAVNAVAFAGADIIAIDATQRPRPVPFSSLVASAHALGKLVLADCSTIAEALAAEQAGADCVAPTLTGYTGGPVPTTPAWDVLAGMVEACDVPVWMEGRIWTPEDVRHAFNLGASAVVVGSAITRPQLITARFASAVKASVSRAD